ncbi:DUF1097 domain-containing protein [Chimaeribacter arupi]|uniref:DUF1097 domain-containing protein n=1 Tax=Nissabacter archeti TaxID=1917880 RepID=A0ABS5JJV1_9GAMM|nr:MULTISPECIES: DUF1097 domain-containing protein [Yersiniaceae]MBS0970250.1 DUF1097 domain-containing protein [Nissabacter archeti]MDV5140501.1 DUF1097 domain-containing protein [Chimaeribacter arupi]WKZ93473.1 DUF1097 domain-containing protein [Chimaeribacter arupi]
MNVLLSLALTTGLLSGLWAWVAVSLGLLGWAGFLGCTAYFACPQGGLRGLAVAGLTTLSGVFWAQVIMDGTALQPEWTMLGYLMTGVVSFLMCVQAANRWLAFVPGTFIGACAMFAAQGNWRLVLPSLLVGLVFGYAMKNSGLWLAARSKTGKAGRQPVTKSR